MSWVVGKKLTVLSYSCKCVVLDHRVSLLYSHPSFLSPSVRSSPQPPVCAPWFIPSSFWRGIPRRTERGAGESRRFRWSSDPLPANQCSSQRLLSKLYGEKRPRLLCSVRVWFMIQHQVWPSDLKAQWMCSIRNPVMIIQILWFVLTEVTDM